MYYNINFDRRHDDELQNVIDNGKVVRGYPGNWDLIEYNGSIYYIAKEPGCGSGLWGSKRYFQAAMREELEKAVNRYRANNGIN